MFKSCSLNAEVERWEEERREEEESGKGKTGWKDGREGGGGGGREGRREIRTGVSQTQLVPELLLLLLFFATYLFIAQGMPLETENKPHWQW